MKTIRLSVLNDAMQERESRERSATANVNKTEKHVLDHASTSDPLSVLFLRRLTHAGKKLFADTKLGTLSGTFVNKFRGETDCEIQMNQFQMP